MDPRQVEQRADGAWMCKQCGFAWSLDRETVLERLETASDRLREKVTVVGPGAMDVGIREGLWSPREYIAHLADWAGIIGKRLHKMLAEDSPAIEDLDQDKLAADNAYPEWDVEESLVRYAKGIAHTIEHVRDGGDDGWVRVGMKAPRGAVPVSEFAQDLLHELEHHSLDIRGNPPG
ncbi:MAG: maleylpyruvate isomerase N-terminal domain-containing protein [Chloroflexi bacterium]|nr:maleylpyruvate isomerase N-terminal domain-containing protein [Chloroflexota bacterium]